MTVAKVVAVTVLAGSLSIGLALFGERWLDTGEPKGSAMRGNTEGVLRSLPDISLPNLEGRQIASSSWAGKVVILNYWATWCPPCLREMPMLVELQKTYGIRGLQVVGVAIDRPTDVARFLEENQVNYPVLLGETEAIETSRKLGNRTGGLPFTVIFDRVGRRIYSHSGELGPDTVRKQLLPLLSNSG